MQINLKRLKNRLAESDFPDVRRTNGKHILHDLKPSPKRSPNKISSIRKTLFELILFPKTKKQTNSDCDISLTPYPHLSI